MVFCFIYFLHNFPNSLELGLFTSIHHLLIKAKDDDVLMSKCLMNHFKNHFRGVCLSLECFRDTKMAKSHYFYFLSWLVAESSPEHVITAGLVVYKRVIFVCFVYVLHFLNLSLSALQGDHWLGALPQQKHQVKIFQKTCCQIWRLPVQNAPNQNPSPKRGICQ